MYIKFTTSFCLQAPYCIYLHFSSRIVLHVNCHQSHMLSCHYSVHLSHFLHSNLRGYLLSGLFFPLIASGAKPSLSWFQPVELKESFIHVSYTLHVDNHINDDLHTYLQKICWTLTDKKYLYFCCNN